MVKRTRDTDGGEDTQEFAVIPGPAEEAEGTIHPAEEPVEEPIEELPQPEPEPEPDSKVSNDEIVAQVLRGEWGVGQDRRLRLHLAGYNPNEIQKELVRRANPR